MIQSGRNQIPSQEKTDVEEIGEPRFETELDSNLGSASASHKGQGKPDEILGGGDSGQSGVYL